MPVSCVNPSITSWGMYSDQAKRFREFRSAVFLHPSNTRQQASSTSKRFIESCPSAAQAPHEISGDNQNKCCNDQDGGKRVNRRVDPHLHHAVQPHRKRG